MSIFIRFSTRIVQIKFPKEENIPRITINRIFKNADTHTYNIYSSINIYKERKRVYMDCTYRRAELAAINQLVAPSHSGSKPSFIVDFPRRHHETQIFDPFHISPNNPMALES
ncbi:hypothetical protein L1049_005992 [Liquidambar formosana]|uniref:Uncharacterized protein n=1 Tax=Liquidambar formosana TaxID=63359 RepID=A0AAP0WQV3_LIQFO